MRRSEHKNVTNGNEMEDKPKKKKHTKDKEQNKWESHLGTYKNKNEDHEWWMKNKKKKYNRKLLH